jgi:hypothetical protein
VWFVLFQVNVEEEGAKPEEPGLNMELLYSVHDTLREMVSWTAFRLNLRALWESRQQVGDSHAKLKRTALWFSDRDRLAMNNLVAYKSE